MELEEAIKRCKHIVQNFNDMRKCELPPHKFIINSEDSDYIKTVLQALEKITEERDIYKEEHDKITKVLNFKEGSLNPSAELVIESLKKALQNSIPKKKIEDKIKELKQNQGLEKEGIFNRENVECIEENGKINILQELLEDK